MDKTSTESSDKALASNTTSDTLSAPDEAIDNESTAAETDAAREAINVLLVELEAAISRYKQTIASIPKALESNGGVKVVNTNSHASSTTDIDSTPSAKKVSFASADKDVRKPAMQVPSKLSEKDLFDSDDETDDDDDSSESDSDDSNDSD